jgi:hypothetical protein
MYRYSIYRCVIHVGKYCMSCICMCVYILHYVSACTYILCTRVWVYIYISLHVWVKIHVCECTIYCGVYIMHVCICVCIYIYIILCVCTQVCLVSGTASYKNYQTNTQLTSSGDHPFAWVSRAITHITPIYYFVIYLRWYSRNVGLNSSNLNLR